MQPSVNNFRSILMAAAYLITSVFPTFAAAQEPNHSVQDVTDVRLVIDVSGSMKRNDPNNLRQPAVELLVELLPEQSKAGVWTFGKWVNMLIPHREVNQEWRELARAEAGKINSVGLFTNIGEALEKAAYDINYVDKSIAKNIILLTDGMVDIDKQPQANQDEWRRIVDEVIPKLSAAGYKIHTIALSKNADRDLMDKLSVATDGVADVAYSAEDLMKIFLKAFDAAVPAEQVALEDNAFVIDSSVEEFTALIFRKDPTEQTQIISPDEQILDASSNDPDIRWHRTNRYDLITVSRPLEGAWQVVADMEADSRVTVVSNLNLRVRPLPNNVIKGTELDLSAFLQEDGHTITNSDFLSLMGVEASLEGGRDYNSLVELWREPLTQNASSFVGSLPALDKEGVYQVSIFVDGKTFTREYKQQITLRQAFSASVREEFADGRLNYVLSVNAFTDNVDFARTRVVATIITPERRRLVRPLVLSELDSWLATIKPVQEGQYTANIQVKGLTLAGNDVTYELDPLTFNYSVDGGLVTQGAEFNEPDAEPEPEPEPENTQTPEATPKPDPTKVVTPAPKESIPEWVLYAALGVGNLLLFSGGFFAYKKIMGGRDDDILSEIDREVSGDAEESAEEETSVDEPTESDDLEEEPPMEDLDPDVVMPELDPEPEMDSEEEIPTLEPDAEPEMALDTDDDDDDVPLLDAEVLEPDESGAAMDGMSEFDDAEAMEDGLDEIDDLEEMSMEVEDEPVSEGDEPEGEDDEEDMVTAMLKAQGLDLAEDELDDAISSLIDDLDDDDLDDDFGMDDDQASDDDDDFK